MSSLIINHIWVITQGLQSWDFASTLGFANMTRTWDWGPCMYRSSNGVVDPLGVNLRGWKVSIVVGWCPLPFEFYCKSRFWNFQHYGVVRNIWKKKSMTSSLELVLHIYHQCQQNNVTLGISSSLVRGLYMISMAHYDVLYIFVIQAFGFSFIFKNTQFSSLLFSFEHCKIYFFFYLFLFSIISNYA